MFKWFKKFNLSQPTIFWRYSLIIFGIGLVIIFIGQTVFLFIMGEITLSPIDSLAPANSASELDLELATRLVGEIKNRPARLADILATTTFFVDPSL